MKSIESIAAKVHGHTDHNKELPNWTQMPQTYKDYWIAIVKLIQEELQEVH